MDTKSALHDFVDQRFGQFLDRNIRCGTCVNFGPDLFGISRCGMALWETDENDRCEGHVPNRTNQHIQRGIDAFCDLTRRLLDMDGYIRELDAQIPPDGHDD